MGWNFVFIGTGTERSSIGIGINAFESSFYYLLKSKPAAKAEPLDGANAFSVNLAKRNVHRSTPIAVKLVFFGKTD